VSDVLVLNADAQPVSYLPLSVIQWQDAITYMWLDKCTVLEWYDDWMVHSASWETRVPAVIMLKEMMRRRRSPRFSKSNIFLRDLYTCQYCSTQFNKNLLTMDHVKPLSKGGKTSWENIVTACNPCNSRKGNDERIVPKVLPYQPDYYELVNKRKQMQFDVRHPSWYLFLN
jgi:5-methylcytosine-specific restriction endonuclease McrA